MPRYFFNVFDGTSEIDRVGTLLNDPDHARQEAIKAAGRILDDEAHRLRLGELWYMEVMDDNDIVLFRLDFQITDPSVLHSTESASG